MMKTLSFSFLLIMSLTQGNVHQEQVEFVCLKRHSASQTCHYNFKVDGERFRFVDIGCKFKKTTEVVEKVKEGDLALAKDWKIICPEVN